MYIAIELPEINVTQIIGKTEKREETNAFGRKCRNSARSVYGSFEIE